MAPTFDIETLRSQSFCRVLSSQDAEFPRKLERWASQRVKTPLAIVLPDSVEDVSSAVRYATKTNVAVAIKCGGMSPDGSSTCDGIIIDLQNMNQVEVKGETAIVGGGALGEHVDVALSKVGRATVTPNVNRVGFLGFALGGGFGKLSGKYGLGLDNIVSATMVLADGTIVTTSKHEREDLFWAIRGGGGNFGIITTLEVKTYKVPLEIFSSLLVFPLGRAAEIFDAVVQWEEHQDPHDTCFVIIRHVEGKGPMCLSTLNHIGDEETGRRQFKPLFDLEPLQAVVKMVPWSQANIVPMDWNIPTLSTFSAVNSPSGKEMQAVVDQLSRDLDDKIRHVLLVSWVHMSKIASIPTPETPFASRATYANIILFSSLEDHTEPIDRAAKASKRMKEFLKPLVKVPATYLNSESHADEAHVRDMYRENLPRLLEVKAKYDPNSVFNHCLHKGVWPDDRRSGIVHGPHPTNEPRGKKPTTCRTK